jgi:hypothetical protein
VDFITHRAFERLDVEAKWAARDPRQPRHLVTYRTGRSAKSAHDVVPHIRREHNTLSHRIDARDGPVMANSLPRARPDILVNTDHFLEKLTNGDFALLRGVKLKNAWR